MGAHPSVRVGCPQAAHGVVPIASSFPNSWQGWRGCLQPGGFGDTLCPQMHPCSGRMAQGNNHLQQPENLFSSKKNKNKKIREKNAASMLQQEHPEKLPGAAASTPMPPCPDATPGATMPALTPIPTPQGWRRGRRQQLKTGIPLDLGAAPG